MFLADEPYFAFMILIAWWIETAVTVSSTLYPSRSAETVNCLIGVTPVYVYSIDASVPLDKVLVSLFWLSQIRFFAFV